MAAWNMRLVSNTPSPEPFAGVTNSDLAFKGNYVIQGNYNGYQVWDITDPRRPTLKTSYLCPASQSDVSVYGNLLFVSGEGLGGRVDCGTQGVPDTVSMDRLRGIRIFDITDITSPKYIANVQTCRGSHTHTVASDPADRSNVYIYVSGSAGIGRHVVEALLEPRPSAYVRSLGPDRFTETAWSWDEARRKAQAVYERYYHIGH